MVDLNFTASFATTANLTLFTPTHDVWDFDDEAVSSWDTDTTAGTEAALESAIQTAMALGTTASPQYHRIAWTGGAISSDWVLTVTASLPDKYGPHILIDGFNGGSTYTDFNAEMEFGTGISNVKFVGFKFRHASNWSSQSFAQPMVRFYNGDNGGRRFSFARNRFGDFWDGAGRNVFSRAFQTGTGAYNIECSIKNNEARDLFEFLEIGVGKWDVRYNLVTGLVDDFASCYGRGNGGEMYLYALGNVICDMHDISSDNGWHPDFIQCADSSDISSDSYRVEAQGNLYIGDVYQQYPTMAGIIQKQGASNTFLMRFEDNIFLNVGTRGFWLPDRRATLHRNLHAWPPLGGAVPTSGTGWTNAPFKQRYQSAGNAGTDGDIDIGHYWAGQAATNSTGWGSLPDPAQIIDHTVALGGSTSYDSRFPNMTGLTFNGSTLIIDNGFSSVTRSLSALRNWASSTYEPHTVANGTGWSENGFNDPANWFGD